jgi:tRNA(fMet)-specific endonuclease VapC
VSVFLLDTSAVSLLMRGDSGYARKIVTVPMSSLKISSITEGELRFGLAKRPEAKRLHLAAKEFLKRVDTLDWDGDAARCYGKLRAAIEKDGKVLGALDLLIAAHAISLKAVLVTSDKAFAKVPSMKCEDWTA